MPDSNKVRTKVDCFYPVDSEKPRPLKINRSEKAIIDGRAYGFMLTIYQSS
jgi:hypothetical protein